MILRFLLKVIGNLLFTLGLGIAMFTYSPIIYSEALYAYKSFEFPENTSNPSAPSVVEGESIPNKIDTSFEYENIQSTVPADEDFGVVIDKISVNTPVVENVDITSEKVYLDALRYGAAHAVGTSLPGQNGNMFIFAHSSLNFWQLGPYATVFNLLSKLDLGDTVVVYYKGKGYVYTVFETSIVHGWNTKPFDQEYAEPVVTLVTCDPPGTTQNRRVIKARLVL